MSSRTLLAPDEVKCQWCNNIFVSPDAYEAHKPQRRGCWGGLKVNDENGLVLSERTGRWGFEGKDSSRRPRRTQAQAALERLISRSTPPKATDARAQYNADIAKIEAALKKARDA